MARSVQQIEQDIQTLEQTVAEFTQELDSLYSRYLEQLGQSIEQQLILASYQLCTQIYPDSFLDLSLNQRQELQKSLRSLPKDLKPSLGDILENSEQFDEDTNVNLVEEIIKNLPLGGESLEQDDITDDSAISSADSKEATASDQEAKEIINQLQNLTSELNKIESPDNDNPYNPNNLIRRQQKIEYQIKKCLDSVSKQANKVLQDANIIPRGLPSQVLDMAIQAENGSSLGGGRLGRLPNIINLAVETEKDKKQKVTRMIQISIIRLRLSEIEFADTTLNAQRTQIRNLLKQVNKIKQRYRNLQQEYARVRAESAWRSSWYED